MKRIYRGSYVLRPALGVSLFLSLRAAGACGGSASVSRAADRGLGKLVGGRRR